MLQASWHLFQALARPAVRWEECWISPAGRGCSIDSTSPGIQMGAVSLFLFLCGLGCPHMSLSPSRQS